MGVDDHHSTGTVFHGDFAAGVPGFLGGSPHPNPQELNNFDFSDDFQFRFPFEVADPNQDLLFAAAAEVNKEEPSSGSEVKSKGKRRRSSPEIDDRQQRKRLADQKYRNKVKKHKEQMKLELDELKDEKGSLIQVIDRLRRENAEMNQTLQSSAEQMRVVSTSHNQLKRDFTRQEAFVQAMLSKLSPESDMIMMDEKQQSEMLRLRLNEAAIRQDTTAVGHMFEELLNEMRQLKKEKKFLEVTVEVLCEKIYSDGHQK